MGDSKRKEHLRECEDQEERVDDVEGQELPVSLHDRDDREERREDELHLRGGDVRAEQEANVVIHERVMALRIGVRRDIQTMTA